MTDIPPTIDDQYRNMFMHRITDACTRFPIPIALTGALTVFLILVTEDFRHWENDFYFVIRVAGTLACGAVWSISAALFAEVRGNPRATSLIIGGVGVLVIAALFWFHREVDLVEYSLFAALVLLVGLTPYLFRQKDNRAFWEFNHDVWIGAAFALIAGLLLGAGGTAILATLKYLFKLDIHRELWPELWIVAFGLVAPLYWLNTIPKGFDVQVAEGDQSGSELTSRMVAVLGKFILVPLLLIYTGILYAYAIKIGIGWELPKGRLGYMVSAFGAVGIATALLVFPSRDASGPFNKFFWRHWFWLTAVPLVMLFIAIYRRINDYGITQGRYLLIIVGLWLLGVVVLFGLRAANRDLRLLPGLLAGILAVTSIGPWGVEGLPARTLTNELVSLLKAEGSLDASGGLKPMTELPAKRDRKTDLRMRSIVSYLVRNDQFDRLNPVLGKDAEKMFVKSRIGRRMQRRASAVAVLERLLIPTHKTKGRDAIYFFYDTTAAVEMPVPEKSVLLGPIKLDFRSDGSLNPALAVTTSTVEANRLDDTLHLKNGGKIIGSYNMRALAERASKSKNVEKRTPFIVEPNAGSGEGRLLMIRLNGKVGADDDLKFNHLVFWILVPSGSE